MEVATSAAVKKAIPALWEMAGKIGGVHVRHKGTIGGSIANSDPAADYPSACLGLGATIVTNKRKIPADDFFTGMFQTALKDGEIITEVSSPSRRVQPSEIPQSGLALCAGGRVCCAGCGRQSARGGDGCRPKVFRVPEMEAALSKNFAVSALAGIAARPRD